MTTDEAVIASIMARSTAASGTAVFVDAVVLRQLLAPLLADLTALRQRHAAAVKSAYIEGRNSDEFDAADKFIEDEYSWLASEARRQLEEGR